MKTYLCAALAAAFSMSGVAVASHQPGHSAVRESRGAGDPGLAEKTDRDAFNEESTTWRVVRYPGRVGTTVVRSPLIVGETITGKRTFISKRGFFQEKEAAEASKSMPRGRGERPTSER